VTGALFALLASLGWGVSDFLGGLRTKSMPLAAVLGVSNAVGFSVIVIVLLVAGGGPPPVGGRLWFAVLAGLAAIADLGLLYRAMATGPVLLTAPIAAAGAVLPVIVGFATGDPAGPLVVIGICCALAGAAGAALQSPGGSGRGRLGAGAGLAVLAALGIGLFLIFARAASPAGPLWAAGTLRASSLVVVAVMLGTSRQARRTLRRAPVSAVLPLLAIGVCDIGADLAYLAASRSQALTVVSTLSSLYPVITVLLAALILRERVSRSQLLSVLLALAGVMLLGMAS
jgi:drug/metabolite transporter (DMT)-like permease